MTRVNKKMKYKRGNVWLFLLIILIFVGLAFKLYGAAEKAQTVNGQKKTGSIDYEQRKESKPKNPSSASAQNKQQATNKILHEKQSVATKVNALMKQMTLKEKVGQLLMVGFYGTQPDETIKERIRDQKIGGIILFDRNMQSPDQVAQLTNQLQKEESHNPVSFPLLIATDQEGGPVLRMPSRVSPIPSEQELGMYATPQEVYQIARLNGEELAAMGINLDFAPVLDLSKQDERSFGSDPERGFNLSLQAVRGLNGANVTATIKHFPGNGRVVVDPHLDISIVDAKKQTLEKVDLVPFKKMMQTQRNNQYFVMVTHVKYPAFDANMPASISRPIIQGLLRDKLGYQGIVITDDLDMGAVSKYYSYDKLGYMALNAGADLLLVCHEYGHQLELYNGIIKAVQTGKLSENRINESVKRILTFKLAHLSYKMTAEQYANQVVKSVRHLRIIENYKK